MINFIKSIGNFYLYSSLHIAICAGLFTWESFILLNKPEDWNYIFFIFCSTVSAYSLHRIIGIRKVGNFNQKGRYKVIEKFKSHIFLYFLISSIGILYFIAKLQSGQLYLLFVPSIITILYMIPVFKNGKRLRDLPLIKIFLIAFVWAWVTFGIPSFQLDTDPLYKILIIERICFVFAITIPFDIRDYDVDKSIDVDTLIHQLGIKKSKFLALAVLMLGFMVFFYFILNSDLDLFYIIPYLLIYSLSGILIFKSKTNLGDWFFGGLLDAMLGLRAIFILLFLYFL